MPHEDSIIAAHLRKDERYEGLVKDCEDSGWQGFHFPVEVGCREFVSHRMKGWLLKLGLNRRKVNKVSKDIQGAVAERLRHCSREQIVPSSSPAWTSVLR